MINPKFRIEKVNGDINLEDKKTMVDGMLTYHASKGHPRQTETYSVLLKDVENIDKNMQIKMHESKNSQGIN